MPDKKMYRVELYSVRRRRRNISKSMFPKFEYFGEEWVVVRTNKDSRPIRVFVDKEDAICLAKDQAGKRDGFVYVFDYDGNVRHVYNSNGSEVMSRTYISSIIHMVTDKKYK